MTSRNHSVAPTFDLTGLDDRARQAIERIDPLVSVGLPCGLDGVTSVRARDQLRTWVRKASRWYTNRAVFRPFGLDGYPVIELSAAQFGPTGYDATIEQLTEERRRGEFAQTDLDPVEYVILHERMHQRFHQVAFTAIETDTAQIVFAHLDPKRHAELEVHGSTINWVNLLRNRRDEVAAFLARSISGYAGSSFAASGLLCEAEAEAGAAYFGQDAPSPLVRDIAEYMIAAIGDERQSARFLNWYVRQVEDGNLPPGPLQSNLPKFAPPPPASAAERLGSPVGLELSVS